MPLEKFFGEAFAGLQLSSSLGRPERTPAATRKFVHHSEHQRQFRPDNSKVRLDLIGDSDERIQALDISGDALRFFSAMPPLAGRAVDFTYPRRLPEFPNQRMLAPSAADDENFHNSEQLRLGGRMKMSNGESEVRVRGQIAEVKILRTYKPG